MTKVFDSYWRFAAKRMALYYDRLENPEGWTTDDPILREHRFTNSYRAADRVSQYLISEIQYHPERSQEPQEVFFRTMLFKLFNKIETWEYLEAVHGPLSWRNTPLARLDETLSDLIGRGKRIYSAAYIMPAPGLGAVRKHSNHLLLLERMMDDRLADRLRQMPDLASVFERLASYPGLGRFLAFQYAIDLNYSELLDFDESDFVIAGPGALDGIAKCFSSTGGMSAERLIYWVVERQQEEFAKRGITYPGLFGRPLQPIDAQNLFCEISKYARVAHPDVTGISGRTRIKQGYRALARPLPPPRFPHRWKLEVPHFISKGPVARLL